MPNQNQALDSQFPASEEDEEEIELEKLEAEMKQMADKILQYIATPPDQLNTTLASILASQRPVISTRLQDGPDPGPSSELNPVVEENEETDRKVEELKQKISSNVSAMPIILNRVKDCISKDGKLGSVEEIIYPAFKRKRTSQLSGHIN